MESLESILHFMARHGWTARIENGLDTTWECTFSADAYNHHYGAGKTMGIAIRKAFRSYMKTAI